MIESVVTEITNTIEGQIAIIINLSVIQGMIEIVTETEEVTEIEIMTKEIEMTEEEEIDRQEGEIGLDPLTAGREKEIVLLIGKIRKQNLNFDHKLQGLQMNKQFYNWVLKIICFRWFQ